LKDEVLKFEILPLERLPSAQPCSSVRFQQNGYYAEQNCVRKPIKTESATAVLRFVVVSALNLQRGRAFVVEIINLT
jgi:hypothetical protein